MRNLNKLITILEKVNFIEEVNDREIVSLQSWVDMNRNLAYEPKQASFIKSLEKILDTRTLNDETREYLISQAKDFLGEAGAGLRIIYELNGIVEGMVYDGELNEGEVCRLKEWMNVYHESAGEIKECTEIINSVESIIASQSINEKEYIQLAEMLNARIKNYQFEKKLDFLCRQVKDKKNIGIDLIDILDNATAMSEIHKRAETEILKALASYSNFCLKPEIIVVSLVLIAMLEYDGNYYENVRATYSHAYGKYSEQKIEGFIRSVLSRYKKNNESSSRTRIINVALENAIVPQTFLTAFFEFIFDIYKLNFEYDLSNELYDDFKFVFEGLRSNMLSDGNDISINVTQKTYKLTAATKQLLTKEEGIEAVIKLSTIIVKLIDKRFWDKEVKIFNPYIKQGYDEWEKQLKETERNKHKHRQGKTELRSRWEPKLFMLNDDIYVVPPVHRVKAQYKYQDIAVVVLNNGEEIYRKNDCSIKEIIGGYQVSPPKIKIDKPLGKLTYRLVCKDEIIYDSKDKLYRNFIAFDRLGNEVNNNTDFEGGIYFCHKEGDVELTKIVSKMHYCLSYKLVRKGETIGIGHDVFNFSSMVKPGIFGELHENCRVRASDAKDLLVYRTLNAAVFEADNSSDKFEVVINGKPHKLSEMKYKSTAREKITKYVLDMDITSSGIYSLEVNQIVSGKRNKILNEEFVYDAELKYETETASDSLYRIRIESGIMDDKIDTEISINEFEIDMFRFKCGNKECSYLLPFDFGFYSVDENEWKCLWDDLWIDDIKFDSSLRIYDSECDSLLVYGEEGGLIEDNIVIKDRGIYKEISIGFLNSYKNAHKLVKLVFCADGKMKHAMFCYNKCVIDEDGIEILFFDDPKRVMVTPKFRGKNYVYFEVFNKFGEKVYMSKAVKSGHTQIMEEFNSFEEYTFNFHEKTKVLMLKKNTLLYSVNKTFYAKQDFVGKDFKIGTVYYDQYIRGFCREKSCNFNRAYVRFDAVLDEVTYEGRIVIKTFNDEFQLDRINPVTIEICSDIIDDTMDVYITNCRDGLLLDVSKRRIMNTIDCPTAPDIFLYTLNMKEEIYT